MLFEGDPDRSRKEQLRRNNEKDSKRLIKQYQLCKMVDKTDKKRFYNRVKSMVECEMKANEHLFVDKCPILQPQPEEETEEPKMSIVDLKEKVKDLEKKREGDERKLVEKKLLQLSVENSEEMRSAAVAKRKKDTSDTNYKYILEKERINKEETVKKRKLACLGILEEIKALALDKDNEKRRISEKKERYRKELADQMGHKEQWKKDEEAIKSIERDEFLKMLEEKKNFEKLELIKFAEERERRREDIKRFIESKARAKSNAGVDEPFVDETFVIAINNHLNSEVTKKTKRI